MNLPRLIVATRHRAATRAPLLATRAVVSQPVRYFASPPQDEEKEFKRASRPPRESIPKISISFHEEDSKYEGQPLVKPQIPKTYEPVYRFVDPTLPMPQRVATRLRHFRTDTINFVLDILCMRKSHVIFKTAAFCKRNWIRTVNAALQLEYILCKVKHGVVHGLKHMAHGLKSLFKDGMWLGGQRAQQLQSKYGTATYRHQTRAREVRQDLIKFVPFSFFLIIPGAEVLLPPWVMIFPNSVPSQFVSADERAQRFKEMKERQNAAASKLMYIWPNYLANLQKDEHINSKDQAKIRELKNLLKD